MALQQKHGGEDNTEEDNGKEQDIPLNTEIKGSNIRGRGSCRRKGGTITRNIMVRRGLLH